MKPIKPVDFPDSHVISHHTDDYRVEITAANIEFLMEKHNELINYILELESKCAQLEIAVKEKQDKKAIYGKIF